MNYPTVRRMRFQTPSRFTVRLLTLHLTNLPLEFGISTGQRFPIHVSWTLVPNAHNNTLAVLLTGDLLFRRSPALWVVFWWILPPTVLIRGRQVAFTKEEVLIPSGKRVPLQICASLVVSYHVLMRVSFGHPWRMHLTIPPRSIRDRLRKFTFVNMVQEKRINPAWRLTFGEI